MYSLSQSDNRIRGWLRDNGVAIPMRNNRQELLQKMRENCKPLTFFSVSHVACMITSLQ